MSGRVALTERFAKTATTDGRKSPIFYDDEVIRFGPQVRGNGRKTFALDCTFEGLRPVNSAWNSFKPCWGGTPLHHQIDCNEPCPGTEFDPSPSPPPDSNSQT